MYRNKTLLESARHEACVACGADDGTVVWAHSNQMRHGKGRGIKAHDIFGAYLCHRCHAQYDQGGIGRDEARALFAEWWEASLVLACNRGVI